MPPVENELLDFAMMIIKEAAETHRKRFTERQIRRIALETLKKDKLHDTAWVENFVLETAQVLREKRREAAGLGAHPEFSGFKVREYQRFTELFGEESFVFMKKHLQDLSQIAPPWAAQFVTAIRLLGGFTAVETSAGDLGLSVWEFVTQKNPEHWSESREARKPWLSRRRPRRMQTPKPSDRSQDTENGFKH